MVNLNNNEYITPRIISSLERAWKRISSKEMGFMDVIVICLTAVSLMVLHWTASATIWMLLWRWVFMLPIMFITALISNDYENLNAKFTYAWVIMTSALPFDDKTRALRNHLGLVVGNWNKYKRQFDKIVKAKSGAQQTALILNVLGQIIKGHITFPQIIYIVFYSFYSIIISSNIFRIPGPYDVMINILFITLLRYWGSDMRGLADLMNDFFIALKPDLNDVDREQEFLRLGEKIKDGCYA